MRHLISISDLTDDDLWSIITTGADLAGGKGVGHPLAGDVIGVYFARFPGLELELRTPPGYGLPFAVNGVAEHHDMDDLPSDVDVIYTTRWQTTGTNKSDPNWRRTFAPFQVSARLWQHSPKAVLMHDLPAHRGEEVTAGELDGPASIAFTQAHNKLFSAMAVLKWCRS